MSLQPPAEKLPRTEQVRQGGGSFLILSLACESKRGNLSSQINRFVKIEVGLAPSSALELGVRHSNEQLGQLMVLLHKAGMGSGGRRNVRPFPPGGFQVITMPRFPKIR